MPTNLAAAEDRGLQARNEIVSSAKIAAHSATTNTGSGVDGSAKLAQAAEAIDQLIGVVHQLRDASQHNAKLAASLVSATKLAQDGAIDVSDILATAQRALANGKVKLSALDDFMDPTPIGEVCALSAASSANQNLDCLTSYLRTRR